MGSNLIGRAINSFRRIGDGLKTVLMHSFREPTTKEYPDIVPELSAHFRGRLALTVNPDTGEHLCISCRQCERVCPDKCIEITAHKSPDTNKLELIEFKIDHGLCMFCGLCTEVCPTSCIINTNDFEMADYSRESLVYDLRRLTLTQEESAYYFERKEMPKPKPKAAKPAADAAAKPAPAAKPAADAAAKPAPAAKPAADAAAKPAADTAEKEAEKPQTPAAGATGSDTSEKKKESKPAAEPAKDSGASEGEDESKE
jgi:NADH-quinone oxidoreductase subunit I